MGEKLNGKIAYEKLLAFHTTTNMTADEVYDLGWKHVNLLYPQVKIRAVFPAYLSFMYRDIHIRRYGAFYL